MRKQYHIRFTETGNLIWDVDRLVKLTKDLQIQEVPLHSIKELDENFWFQQHDDIPTCRAIADHARLIAETDLQFPIILSSAGRVMDGMHRVAKAYLNGNRNIKVVQFKEDPAPDYLNKDLNDLPY